jgi:hypothetical protein
MAEGSMIYWVRGLKSGYLIANIWNKIRKAFPKISNPSWKPPIPDEQSILSAWIDHFLRQVPIGISPVLHPGAIGVNDSACSMN